MKEVFKAIYDLVSLFGGPALGLKLAKWVNMEEGEAKGEIEAYVYHGSRAQIKELENAFEAAIKSEGRPWRREQLFNYYRHFKNAVANLGK